jgi:hypothetical protein
VYEMDRQYVVCTAYNPCIFIFIILLPGCGLGPRTKVLTRKINPETIYFPTTQPPVITIWIHGTRIFPPSLFKTIFNGKPSLKHLSDLDSPSKLDSIAHILSTADPYGYSLETFYFFGWSGKLSFASREQSAKILYEEIKRIVDEYEDVYTVKPRIRIIAHSHGGNVALNLAKQPERAFFIDELILLACPVQSRTMHLTSDPLFKTIYSLYSRLDLIQILDPQGLYLGESNGLFSHRLFPNHSNIIQVKLKINGRALLHTEFITSKLLSCLPAIVSELNQWRKEHPEYIASWVRMNKLICLYTNGRSLDMHKYMYRNHQWLQYDSTYKA